MATPPLRWRPPARVAGRGGKWRLGEGTAAGPRCREEDGRGRREAGEARRRCRAAAELELPIRRGARAPDPPPERASMRERRGKGEGGRAAAAVLAAVRRAAACSAATMAASPLERGGACTGVLRRAMAASPPEKPSSSSPERRRRREPGVAPPRRAGFGRRGRAPPRTPSNPPRWLAPSNPPRRARPRILPEAVEAFPVEPSDPARKRGVGCSARRQEAPNPRLASAFTCQGTCRSGKAQSLPGHPLHGVPLVHSALYILVYIAINIHLAFYTPSSA
ncbi:hypothetical protein PVAP13_3KG410302 [Panicum virgatum]|uniref:Uncharacterized protein n=1 Tax=Panicum virgatum TaxID=38727 RepID=A0A8T0UXV0_PANVG|nr:hypothetical protein PVAP13_3KG410302 [Panicum virgatum]